VSRLSRLWARIAHAVSWTPPTSTEISTVAKSALAAGLAWWVARMVSDVPDPVLASLTSLVVVQVSVRTSMRVAIERSAAVVLGVFVALGVGDALGLNGVTVTILVAASLTVAQLVLRLPPSAARQVPVSAMLVITAASASRESLGWRRALDTVVGAAVGVVVAFVLPASRVVDARQTIARLGDGLAGVLESMGAGLQQTWSTEETTDWRTRARTVRERLVDQAEEAVGNGREVARWNVRDRRHIDELGRYENALPRFERTAIGVSVIARGLDDHARLSGTSHVSMVAMGTLLETLARLVRASTGSVLGTTIETEFAAALAAVRAQRERCVQGAARRARIALEENEADPEALRLGGEWLSYAALLVQVDRIVADLSAPLPA
jgi:uncharacterized membrane protein YgaE (UPF0421/DUF939 family)